MQAIQQGMPVRDEHGLVGVVETVENSATGTASVLVRREDGTTFMLSPDMYVVDGDTVWLTTASSAQMQSSSAAQHTTLDADEATVIPVVQEEAVIRTRKIDRGGVRIHKQVNEREEVVQQPLTRETVNVERVPVGQVVDIAPGVRQEGDTLIIPVLEEVLVVEKRLVLKEELWVTRRQVTETEEVRVQLREEEVTLENIEPAAEGDEAR